MVLELGVVRLRQVVGHLAIGDAFHISQIQRLRFGRIDENLLSGPSQVVLCQLEVLLPAIVAFYVAFHDVAAVLRVIAGFLDQRLPLRPVLQQDALFANLAN